MFLIFTVFMAVVFLFTPVLPTSTQCVQSVPIIQSVEGLKDNESANIYNPFKYLKWAYEERSSNNANVVNYMTNNSYFTYNGAVLNSGLIRKTPPDDDFVMYRAVFWFDEVIPADMTFSFVIDESSAMPKVNDSLVRVVFQEHGTDIYSSYQPHYEIPSQTKALYDNTYQLTRIYMFRTLVSTSHFHIEFPASRTYDSYGILSIFAGDIASQQTYDRGYENGYNEGYAQGDTAGYQRGYDDGFIQTLDNEESFFYGLIQIFKYMIGQLSVLFETKVVGDLNIAFFVIGIPGIFMVVNFGFKLIFKWIGGK